jgi:hypothetical protein
MALFSNFVAFRNQISTTNGDDDIEIALQARKETMQIPLVALI